MKNQIFTFVFFFSALVTFSQGPTLTSSNSAPQPGDSYTRYNADTTNIVPGDAGAGKTWNFSNLVLESTLQVYNYVAPSSTPYAALYPDATVSYMNDPLYGYYKVTPSDYETIGMSSSVNSWIYSDPEVMFTYPFSYGSNLVDNLYATSSILGTTHYRIGTRTTIADGYGTLILPSGTFNNLLRVKVIQNYSDSSAASVTHVYAVSYSWYDGVNKSPALILLTLSNTTGGSTSTEKAVSVSSAVSGIANLSSYQGDIIVTPNPAHDKVTVHLPEAWSASESTISVYTTDGALMMQQAFRDKSVVLEISALSRGVYIIKFSRDKKFFVSKLIKE